MADPVAGLEEMARVTRGGGVVAACVWDYGGGTSPLSPFWNAARELDPDVDDESGLPGARAGHLTELFDAAGLRAVQEIRARGRDRPSDFRGLVGALHARRRTGGRVRQGARSERRAELRELARARLPEPPFELTGRAWAARGLV